MKSLLKIVSIFLLTLIFYCAEKNPLSPGNHKVNVNGLNLRYTVAGQGPVLVVQGPGWGLGSALYQQTLMPLEKDFTMVYYDTRGSGESAAPEKISDINIGAEVEDLEGLRKALGLPALALLAHSHGGIVALNYAIKYPKNVSKLILAGSLTGVNEMMADVGKNLPALAKDKTRAQAVGVFATLPKLKTDQEFNDFFAGILPLYFYDLKNMQVLTKLKLNRLSLAVWNNDLATGAAFAVKGRLNAVTAPVLIINGKHDFISSDTQTGILKDGLKNVVVSVYEKSGHFFWLEEPEKFYSDVRDFVNAKP